MATTTTEKSFFDLNALFGGKQWFRSMTAWGLAIFAIGSQAVTALGTNGIITPELTAFLAGHVDTFGVVLGMLGIRRRL